MFITCPLYFIHQTLEAYSGIPPDPRYTLYISIMCHLIRRVPQCQTTVTIAAGLTSITKEMYLTGSVHSINYLQSYRCGPHGFDMPTVKNLSSHYSKVS